MALPNLRRLFVEARTEAEENEYSRNAVSKTLLLYPLRHMQDCIPSMLRDVLVQRTDGRNETDMDGPSICDKRDCDSIQCRIFESS